MRSLDSTCWQMIRGAAAGSADERREFVERYEPVVRAYLVARWRGSHHLDHLDDAVQEVFVECLRQGGVLERAMPDKPGGFRAFLFGVVRNVARRMEVELVRRREHQPSSSFSHDGVPADDDSLSRVFDHSWAEAMMVQAAERMATRARIRGERGLKRVELLRLRFHENLPIREIARRWEVDPAYLHREYALAREEFHEALIQVVSFHHPGTSAEVDSECASLLALLE